MRIIKYPKFFPPAADTIEEWVEKIVEECQQILSEDNRPKIDKLINNIIEGYDLPKSEVEKLQAFLNQN